MGDAKEPRRRAVIGNASSFWIYDSDRGFDLTHPETPTSPPVQPRITIQTTTEPIIVDPVKTALVIIDMQNYFLSPAFSRTKGAGHAACEKLISYAIPAARKAGVRVIWLNWGLTEQEVNDMPPAVKRAFGYETLTEDQTEGEGLAVDKHGRPRSWEHDGPKHIYKGIGKWCGELHDPESGQDVDAGLLLMRDQWNTALYAPLDKLWREGQKLAQRPDVWVHKNRMSGMWGAKTECEEFLENEGIKTLLFAGVNTDQCVGGSYTDSFSKGYDAVLLSDGCGTTSPHYAQQCFEFNAAKTFGFCCTCEDFSKAVDSMQ